MNVMDQLVVKIKEEIECCGESCKMPVSEVAVCIEVVGKQLYINVKCKVPGEKTNNIINVVYERIKRYGKLMGVVINNAPYEFNLTLSVDEKYLKETEC